MVAVREVKTRHIHASVEHLDEHLCVPASGSQSTDDFGLAMGELNLLKDVLEADATGVGTAGGCFYHSVLTVSSKK